MDGTRVMYRVKPIFELPDKIELPTCMYPMRKILNYNLNPSRCDNNEILDNIMDKKPLPELSALETRWDQILDQLNDLVNEVKTLKQQISILGTSDSPSCLFELDKKNLDKLKVIEGAVINANPSKPPYSLFLIKKLCKNFITLSSHVHSSVDVLPQGLQNLCKAENDLDLMKITLIWKKGLFDSELVLNPIKQISIRGEVNILRHLGRMGLDLLHYPLNDTYETVQIDSLLDICHSLQHTEVPKEVSSMLRNLSAKLGRNSYFGGETFNITDIAVWSVIKQMFVNGNQDLTANMAKWFNKMDNML